MLLVALILLGFSSATIHPVSSGSGGKIDLFTQKEPHSGRGANVSSDIFTLSELVIVYAYVSYNDYREAAADVGFQIFGPSNSVANVSFFDYGRTNDSGVCSISFRIGRIDEIYFGTWTVVGTVLIDDTVYQDFLFFNVSRVIEVVSIRTMDENFVNTKTSFLRGDGVGIELGVINNAMVEKNATLAVTLYDSRKRVIDSGEVDNYTVPANRTLVYVYMRLQVPMWAFPGEGIATADAYTEPVIDKGIPYSSQISTGFFILSIGIAITSVVASPNVVRQGEIVDIETTVVNTGELAESFNVDLYRNGSTLIDQLHVSNLPSNGSIVLDYSWNTSGVDLGYYVISAYAEPVPGEAELADNKFVDGTVQIIASIHDIAVDDLYPSSHSAIVGDVLKVTVVVNNTGTYTESFNVTLYWNSTVMRVISVENMTPGEQRTLSFNWDTRGLAVGDYVLSAQAGPVEGEVNVSDNHFVDGTVTLSTRFLNLPYWFWWLLLLLLLLLALILLLLLLYRRRKRGDSSFYQGWTAWYFQHSLVQGEERKHASTPRRRKS